MRKEKIAKKFDLDIHLGEYRITNNVVNIDSGVFIKLRDRLYDTPQPISLEETEIINDRAFWPRACGVSDLRPTACAIQDLLQPLSFECYNVQINFNIECNIWVWFCDIKEYN